MAKKSTSKPAAAPDPLEIFVTAESFFAASTHLHRDLLGPKPDRRLIIPTTVLRAFALELHMKCLIALETGTSPWGHSLKDLFNALPIGIQLQAEKSFKANLKNNPAVRAAAQDASVTSLTEALVSGDLIFERLRYFHELIAQGSSSGKGSFLLGDVHKAVREAILKRKPEWPALVPPKLGSIETITQLPP
jgi:hypothetical protein